LTFTDSTLEWRWLKDRTDSPWYPRVLRLFQQNDPGVWAPVIADVINALALEKGSGIHPTGSPPPANFLYHNNRDGTFTQITEGDIVTDSNFFCGAAWADYDNDGWLDLFVTSNGGPNYLYHNNGDGTFSRVFGDEIVSNTAPLNVPDSSDLNKTFINASWADYDNDGWLDLFVGSRVPPVSNLLYHNNGDGTFTRVTSGPLVGDNFPVGGAAWGDYDRDGFPDLFVSVAGIDGEITGPGLLYHNEGTANQWLQVRLNPSQSNRSALGTRVRLTATIGGQPVTQLREINTGDGFSGGMVQALFGLGDATNYEKIVVEWPSGAVSTSPPQIMPLVYSNGTAVRFLDIYEPQPIQLNALLVKAAGAQKPSIQLEFSGGDGTSYFASGKPISNLKYLRHHYGIESSSDLIHWTSAQIEVMPGIGGLESIADWPVGSLPTGANRLFLRARDLGFQEFTSP
jgi:hypothetical protein